MKITGAIDNKQVKRNNMHPVDEFQVKLQVLEAQNLMLSRICKARNAEQVADLIQVEADRLQKEADELNAQYKAYEVTQWM